MMFSKRRCWHVGILSTSAGFLDALSSRDLFALGARIDLAPRRVRRADRSGLFLDPGCACDLRIEAPRPQIRMGLLVVRHLYHGLRPDAYPVDLYPVGTDLRHRRPRQSRYRCGIRLHRRDALAVAADPSRDPFAIRAS